MSIDIGPRPSRDEEVYYAQRRERRSSQKDDMSTLGTIVAFCGIALAFIVFAAIRNAVIEVWNGLPF